MPPHWVGLLGLFNLKTGIHFAHFGLEGATGKYQRVYRFNSKWVRKKEKVCEFDECRFEESFCLRSNLSNDNVIFALWRGLKTGMDFRGLVWKRVWKITFLVWNRVRILRRTGRHTPTKNFSSTSSSIVFSHLNKLCRSKARGLNNISAKIIRECADLISVSLCDLFNKSLLSGIFPDDWKCARVTPLFTQGKPFDLNNYRPILVISVMA